MLPVGQSTFPGSCSISPKELGTQEEDRWGDLSSQGSWVKPAVHSEPPHLKGVETWSVGEGQVLERRGPQGVPVLVKVTIAVIKHHDQTKLERKRFI